jgi:hypothetical protein
MDLFRRYMAFVIRTPVRYESVIRPEVRDRFAFTKEFREEAEGLIDGIAAKLGTAGMKTQFGRALDVLDILAIQALPDWYPFACSAFAVWDDFAPDGPIVGRNMDFFVHPVLLENHLLIVNARTARTKAFVSLSWPGMIGVLTGMNEEGVVAFLLDAAPKLETDKKGFVARTLAARTIVERANPLIPAGHAHEMLKDAPTRWGGCLFVAGPHAGSAHGSVGVLERDARGTTLRDSAGETVLEGMPAFACTNHFRVRADPVPCTRYQTIADRLTSRYFEAGVLTPDDALAILTEARQRITLQSMVANLKTREIRLRLARVEGPDAAGDVIRFSGADLFGEH